ncbi:MAG: ATP-dependent RecD-like DNA helicase [Bacilli bacterium]
MSSVTGMIRKIIYVASDTGYRVGLFKVKEATEDIQEYVNKTISFTGKFLSVDETLVYKLTGEMVNNPRYGLQFAVNNYESVKPVGTDAMILYLSSGLIKGIGLKTAEKIVELFKEDSIKEIIKGNKKLLKIKGLTIEKIVNMRTQLMAFERSNDLVLELSDVGFSTPEVLLLVQKYQDNLKGIISTNPYFLSDDITFEKLDHIYLKNHKEDEDTRVEGLIKYLIKEYCWEQGDTIVKTESLYLRINKWFSRPLETEEFLRVISNMIENQTLYKSGEYVTLMEYFMCEEFISSRVKELNKIKSKYKKEDIETSLNSFEKSYKISLSNTQRKAVIESVENNLYIISGGPGTGKTTIIQAIVDVITRVDPNILISDITLLAPTGRAAARLAEIVKVKASTIHKFLKWNKDDKTFGVNENNQSNTKVIIIDESSMVDIFLLSALFSATKKNIKLIMVGDDNQLPSISPGNILTDLLYVDYINKVKLSDVYRTSKDSFIIDLCSLVRTRETITSFPPLVSDVKFISSTEEEILPNIEKISNEIKEKNEDLDNFQVLAPMYKGRCGIDSLNKTMQNIFNKSVPSSLEIVIDEQTYRRNDKVIQLVNDVDNNIYNGDTGYIKSIYKGVKNSNVVEINFSGKTVSYTGKKIYEFTHAYAISIHKSQGSEYDNVVIVLSKNFKRMLYNKLIYTGISRAKKSLTIIGSLEALNEAIQTDSSENRDTLLKTLLNE